MIKGVIFDVDGTLIDSLSMWEEIDKIYIESKGYIYNNEVSQALFNMRMEEATLYIKDYYNIEDSLNKMVHDITSIATSYYINKCQLKKGVINTLEYFYKQNIPMIIATSNHKSLVEKVLERHNISKYFINIITSDEIGYGKERIDIYEKACEYLNSNKSTTLIFEDALYAIKTCVKHNYKVVGCYDKYSKEDQDMIKEISTYYVKEMDEIIDGNIL